MATNNKNRKCRGFTEHTQSSISTPFAFIGADFEQEPIPLPELILEREPVLELVRSLKSVQRGLVLLGFRCPGGS